MFVNCGFDCNKTGFLIDNSKKQSNNQAHGSAVGCTFNHSDNNKGIGIQILGANWGYVFSACQIWYSKIVLENSNNISFNTANMGRCLEIEINGGSLTLFTDCPFIEHPKLNIENNELVKFINCFTKDGEPITA